MAAEVTLVVVLSVLVGWVLRSLAPPSLMRDGQRLPVGLGAQHATTGHHAGDLAGMQAPSPIIDEPVPHFLGGAFLAAHLLAIALAVGTRVARRLGARSSQRGNTFAGQLMLAGLVAVTTGAAVLLSARFGYGDRLPFRMALSGGLDAMRYAFVIALAMVVFLHIGSRDLHQVRSGST